MTKAFTFCPNSPIVKRRSGTSKEDTQRERIKTVEKERRLDLISTFRSKRAHYLKCTIYGNGLRFGGL